MALSFGKLMKEANKNYVEVSGKISQIDSGKKTKDSKGPDIDAVRAFLNKKKEAERQQIAKRLEEDKKRLLENKAKEDRKQATKLSLLNQMLKGKSTPPNDSAASSFSEKAPQKMAEERRSEQAFSAAREKLKDNPKLVEKNHHRHQHQDKTATETKDVKMNSAKKISPTQKSQVVDFKQLMMVAQKNEKEKVHYDDLTDNQKNKLKLKAHIISQAIAPSPKSSQPSTKTFQTPIDVKPKLKTLVKAQVNGSVVKSQAVAHLNASITPSVKPNNFAAKKSNSSASLVDTSAKITSQKVKSVATPVKSSTAAKSVNNIKNTVPISKNVPSLNKGGLNKAVVPPSLNNKVAKSQSQVPVAAKKLTPPNQPRNISSSNLAKAPKRPGTPPQAIPPNHVFKKPKMLPVVRHLPSTSGQSFTKKSDLERALVRRREMLFKNPHKYEYENEEEDEEEEYDPEMDDFIDDTEYENQLEYKKEIRKMFKYDPSKYRHLDGEDDRRMEASYKEIEKEEARSSRLGLLEDLQDIQREQEEKKNKAKKAR